MHRLFRITFPLLFAAVCIFLGSTFYSRWRDKQVLLRQLEQRKDAQNKAFIQAYGGGVKIMGFYALPGVIEQGGKAQLCYSVVNTEEVRIEPPVGDVWPSRSRCVDVRPRKTTVYRLVAEDGNGGTKAATATIRVTNRQDAKNQ